MKNETECVTVICTLCSGVGWRPVEGKMNTVTRCVCRGGRPLTRVPVQIDGKKAAANDEN